MPVYMLVTQREDSTRKYQDWPGDMIEMEVALLYACGII